MLSLKFLRYSVWIGLAILLGGCERAGDVGLNSAPDGRTDINGTGESLSPQSGQLADHQTAQLDGAIDADPVDYQGLIEFLESHHGHPIVLDVWSTSCEPCVRELPSLAKLRRDYADRGVVCATLNIDFTGAEGTSTGEARLRALEVLAALDIDAVNLYSTVPDRELLRQALFRDNRAYAPPIIFVFAKSGDVAARLGNAGEADSPYDEVRITLDSMLDKLE